MGDAEGQLPVVLLGANSSENLIISARGCLWNGDEYAQKSGIPTAAACSADGKAAAVAADPKRLLVLKVEGGEAQSRPIFRAVLEVITPKRLACVTFSPDGDCVLCADRFGDVHSIDVARSLSEADADSTRHCEVQNLAEEEAPLLGHFSTVTHIAIAEKFIATGDRENRIRISHYPHAYDISLFCFGHTSFVTRLAWVGDHLLLSGAGDGTVRLWDTSCGVELSCVSLPGPDDTSHPGVISCLAPSPTVANIAVAVVHGLSSVFLLSGLENRILRLAGSFEPAPCQNTSRAAPSGACFDESGALWLSTKESSCVASYHIPSPAGDGSIDPSSVQCGKSFSVDTVPTEVAPTVKTNVDIVDHPTPGDWLTSLRKSVYDPTWKGKGQKRQRGESWLKKSQLEDGAENASEGVDAPI